ncbi:MAG: serine/threonine protein kinase, partial [Myxococcales bacterium]|nr:serine/threonine protein kinase [Myxococcales bacterium]
MNQASHASAAQADPMIGKTIAGRYRVDVLLGAGGMGAVYRAHDLVQERAVALKVLHPDIGRDPQIAKRFDREAQAASRLDHPNIVRVDDHGRDEDGAAFMVMELLEGGELQAQIGPDRPWPAARALDMLEQVLTGLAHAHAAGIVHRDLKPENIFLARDAQGQERAKIV